MLGSDRVRAATLTSLLPPILAVMSREVPLNLLADVFLFGDEAMVLEINVGVGNRQ